jgi:signal transduction histidine kinase
LIAGNAPQIVPPSKTLKSSVCTPPNTIGRWCSAHCPLGKALVAGAVLVCFATPARARDSQATPWRVVILDSSDPSEPAAQAFARVSRNALTSQTSRPIEFYPEFLDSLRFQGALYEAELVAFLTKKYKAKPPDLIVTIYPQALQFVAQHRAELWPDTPAVFVGVPDDLPQARTPPPGFTGVLTLVDIAGTIELARQLQPQLRRVVVVSGASEFDRLWRTRAEEALRGVVPHLEATYLEGLAVPALLDQVGHLKAGDVVLFTTVFRDGDGAAWLPNDVSQLVGKASAAPVYSTFEPSLGHGVVGGSIVGLDAEAQRAGELAFAILNGQPPETIQVEPSPAAVPRIDWREFERWSLREDRLPRGTLVAFRSSSLWSEYRGRIIGAVIVLILQSALIATLLIERRQRRHAELHAQRRGVELAHASRLAAVGEITASIAHQVNQPLGAIHSNADAAEMLLESTPVPLDEVRQILVDIRRDDERASEVVAGMRALLQRGELNVQPVNLNEAIVEVVRLVNGESRRHGIAMELDLAPGLPAIAGDRVHLQQIVLNLVLNGIEAARTSTNQVRRVTIRTALRQTGELEATVEDTGPGIAAEQLPHLFESFFTTKKNGMGLGLSIARSLVEAHGGTIWAENSSQGAIFRIVLPGRTA